MAHGDNIGLVIPPKIANIQIVIVPVYKTIDKEIVMTYATNMKAILLAQNIRVYLDDTEKKPGWKYYLYESKGVPLRIEIGSKDIEKQSVRCVRRDSGAKFDMNSADIMIKIPELLDTIQNDMFKRAQNKLNKSVKILSTKKELNDYLESDDKTNYLFYVSVCDSNACQEKLKDISEGKKVLGKVMCKPLSNEIKELVLTANDYDYHDEHIPECLVCYKQFGLDVCVMGRTF